MKQTETFCLLTMFVFALFFSACANAETKKQPIADSYIGVNIPDFKNDKIDSLVILYEADRALFYQAKANGDMQSYYKSKIANRDGYNVSGFYDQVVKILNTDSDQEETVKFQDYIQESTARSKEFLSKLKEN